MTLLIGVLLAGCGAGSTSSPAFESKDAPAVAPAPASADAASGDAGASSGSGAGTGDTASAERQVVKSAQLGLTVADPAKAAKDVRATADRLGGYVTREEIVTEQHQGLYLRASTVVVAVPSAKLDEALDSLASAGTVTIRSVASSDVTQQVVDVAARIQSLRDSIARIQQLMARAGTLTEVATVERELTSRQSELEAMVAQQKSLAGRVEMSPVTVTLTPSVTAADPNPLLQGWGAGWQALIVSVRVLVTAGGAILPFALVGGAGWRAWRAWKRRGARGTRAGQASAAGDVSPERSPDDVS